MDMQSVLNAYRRHAPYYDAVFGVLLGPGRRQTVELANRLAGRRVLEVGVGTGLSLPRYRSDKLITGIDISPDMLRIARERVAEHELNNVEAILEMDAENLKFADDSFDIICAMYIASVVPHPDRLVAEMQRVCKPNGEILIVNHFAEPNGLRGTIERKLAPLSKQLGWHPDFELDTVLKAGTLTVIGHQSAAPLGLFSILRCKNTKVAAAASRVANG